MTKITKVSTRSNQDTGDTRRRPIGFLLRCTSLALTLIAFASVTTHSQNRSEDEYTRYELLAPETASFKIVYDVTAVSPGAKFLNPIRPGSVVIDESVIDVMTGAR